jgi:hypothetical protein
MSTPAAVMPEQTRNAQSAKVQTSLPAYIKWGVFLLLLALGVPLFIQKIQATTSEMPPVFADIVRRNLNFNPGETSDEFWAQWRHPGDVFSVLLILGGDVVGRALAQVSGSPITPVAFSFGTSESVWDAEEPLLTLTQDGWPSR